MTTINPAWMKRHFSCFTIVDDVRAIFLYKVLTDCGDELILHRDISEDQPFTFNATVNYSELIFCVHSDVVIKTSDKDYSGVYISYQHTMEDIFESIKKISFPRSSEGFIIVDECYLPVDFSELYRSPKAELVFNLLLTHGEYGSLKLS
jgi:hypothetical protein